MARYLILIYGPESGAAPTAAGRAAADRGHLGRPAERVNQVCRTAAELPGLAGR
jgi:hypothetical protein